MAYAIPQGQQFSHGIAVNALNLFRQGVYDFSIASVELLTHITGAEAK